MLKRYALLLIALALFVAAGAVRGPLDDAAARGRLSLGTGRQATRPDEIVVTRMTGGFRALFINALWMRAIVAERNYQYYELSTLYERISMLQPRYPEVWSQIVLNMAFQLTGDPETPEENWEWILKAIEQGEKGVAFNPDDSRIPEKLAYVYYGKMRQDAVVRKGGERYLKPVYRRFLREQKGQTYHERTVYWLNRAFRAKDGNYTPQTLSTLWYLYTILHGKAKGDGNTARAEEYLRLRAEVVAGSRKFTVLHERMTIDDPFDAGIARNQFLQMTAGDLAGDETTDAARWSWTRGGLVLAKEFRTRYDLASREKKVRYIGEPYAYAKFCLEVGLAYVRVGPRGTYAEQYRKEFPKRPALQEAREHYSAALKALWAARDKARGRSAEKQDLNRNREIDSRIVITAYAVWALTRDPETRKELDKEVDRLLEKVKREDPGFHEDLIEAADRLRQEARKGVAGQTDHGPEWKER